ncbi:hypothetical protein [Lactiplantibacillus pentosus]|uniref:hypothetical protein n=1 Tax=Lactiplantibacillus pentosus TaxID=1589 RepID=UPI000A5709FB|nr:hypothetical protein [Lactiplantibacillus pentosus]MCC3164552.1 hypothetical protein [Lactiplantibacillus pentosus]MCJ8180977.1 hypothetical protein [Lactiplantibacillus pentosus]MCJ8189678.1 hypothetical protein [Lactiplantibacillus pentosus]
MTKQRKHTKRSTIKKKRRRMRMNADKHSRESLERMVHDYAPYQVTKEDNECEN